MLYVTKEKYNRFLENLADVLDITETQLKQAKMSYEAVGKWLCNPASPIAKYNPTVYPQGSFRIGTVIKPIADEDNFDVDVVCLLQDWPAGTSQKDLKEEVGNALKANVDYERMLRKREGRRCWTLQYADDRKFHMDILPASPDDFIWILQKGVNYDRAKHAIEITDKECETYEERTDKGWPKSNPVGYGNWFIEQMRTQFAEAKRRLAAFKNVNIESIEDFEVKTPLQRAVQILKRHRDFMFGDDEDRPISIIITTLAARAYGSEETLYDALNNLLDNMPKHVEGEKGKRKVSNPVNPEENFADKWEEYPQREENFYDWLSKAKEDFVEIFNSSGFQKSIVNLREAFDEKLVNQALRNSSLDDFIEERSIIRRSNLSIFSVAHKQAPLWAINPLNTVDISARYKDFRGWHSLVSKNPLLKGVDIQFTAHTNVKSPFDVYWQVVNTGQEALMKDDLRGNIFRAKTAGRGGLQHKEYTKYLGTHWIECFIVKDNVCIARSKEFIVKIE
ncbi:MAG: nucleotidyltransferase [Pyrinomonadaceae bacterium]